MALHMMQQLQPRCRPFVCAHAQKVNSRGKVSSRPGPPSPRDQKKRREESVKQPEQGQVTEAAVVSATQQPQQQAPTGAAAAPPSTAPQAAQRQPPQRVETPQVVVDRIFSRMVGCAGVPLVTGIALLVVVGVLKRQDPENFPLWPAYLAQGFMLLGGLLGISYGALSASWDPAREGSLVGWTEFRANLPLFLKRDENKA